MWYAYAHYAPTMEAIAIRDGARLAADPGYRKVIVESDADDIVKLWNSACFDRAEVAPICREIAGLS